MSRRAPPIQPLKVSNQLTEAQQTPVRPNQIVPQTVNEVPSYQPPSSHNDDLGPLPERQCRDILCCLLFIASLGAYVAVFILSVPSQKILELTYLYSSGGVQCKEAYPYIYYPVPIQDAAKTVGLYYRLCVDKCPSSYEVDSTSSVNTNLGVKYFSLGTTTSNFYIYTTSTYLNRACLPSIEGLARVTADSGGTALAQSTFASTTDTLSKFINDLGKAWTIILASLGIALAIAYIYMLFIRCCAGVIVWCGCILFFACLGYLCYLCYYKGTMDSSVTDANTKQTYEYLSYTLMGVLGLTFVMFLCIFNKIRLAIAIIKTATIYMKDVPTSMLVPLFITVFVGVWWAFWIVGVLIIYSTGTITQSTILENPFPTVTLSEQQQRFVWFWLFEGLWGNAFLQALNQFILASSAVIWYFAPVVDGSRQPHGPVRVSIYRAFRYHLGSLAFGAFLLALVQFIRIVLEVINQQVKKAGGNNKVLQYLINCLRCYMACFERLIKFLNKHAYIQIAIKGSNFCVAAKNAFELIWSNAARMSLVGGIGGAFSFIGQIFVTAATVLTCYLIFIYVDPYKTNLSSAVGPCIVIFFIAIGVAVVFMMVYSVAMDAIFQCFCYDEEQNKGKGGVPAHVPEPLQDFFDKEVNSKEVKS